MAQYRGYDQSFAVGYAPPTVAWTVVKGDTAAFRVYVTDNERNPLTIADWSINMDVVRDGTVIVALTPTATQEDGPGQFTVSLTSEESSLLLTGDIFDIQMSDPANVWTVARGSMIMIDSVTE